MTNFLSFQTIIQFRIPLNDDGTTGNPEILRKFTTEFNGKHPRKKVVKKLESVKAEEVYL